MLGAPLSTNVVDVVCARWTVQARLPSHRDQLPPVVRGVVAHVVDDVGQGDQSFAFTHRTGGVEVVIAHVLDEIAKGTAGVHESIEHLSLGEHLFVLHNLVPRGALEGGEPTVFGIPEVADGEVEGVEARLDGHVPLHTIGGAQPIDQLLIRPGVVFGDFFDVRLLGGWGKGCNVHVFLGRLPEYRSGGVYVASNKRNGNETHGRWLGVMSKG